MVGNYSRIGFLVVRTGKVPITIFFFELTDNDGQNFLGGIVHFYSKKKRTSSEHNFG
jgi:hypothetical protein